jgi:hypothetical protein
MVKQLRYGNSNNRASTGIELKISQQPDACASQSRPGFHPGKILFWLYRFANFESLATAGVTEADTRR